MLNPKALGMAGGIVWGVGLFIFTFVGMNTSLYAVTFFDLIIGVYPGYSVSTVGAFIGLVYGFVDAFVGLYLFGHVYNLCLKHCK